jgi:hypothetical protein
MPEGEVVLPGSVSYFQGKGRSLRGAVARRFCAVVYHELHPGIAVRVKVADRSGHATPLEYDVLAKPGADLSRLVIATDGIEEIRLEDDGSLALETPAGIVCQPPPIAWIETSTGEKTPILCRYRLLDAQRYGFEAPGWDGRTPLVIDPVVAWSRFLGGESEDSLIDAKVREADGALIVAGNTRSLNFPELDEAMVSGDRNGSLDAVVLSFDASSGNLRGAAVLGGEMDDEARSIAIGSEGTVIIAGHSESSDFPVTIDIDPGQGASAFVARFSADLAELEYSTILGGSGEDRAGNVVLGEDGSAWVLGLTDSWDFPVTSGCFRETRPGGRYDLFVTQLRMDGALPLEEQIVYSTYLGGSGSEPLDFGDTNERLWELALAIDQSGRPCVGGRTDSANFPTTPGARDRSYAGDFSKAFVTVLAPGFEQSEQLVYSTYLGGASDASTANDIAVDSAGSLWITGFTWSNSFPTTADAYDRTFYAPNYGCIPYWTVTLSPRAD